MMLADYGANVIKIEPTGGGDFCWTWAPFSPDQIPRYGKPVSGTALQDGHHV